MLQNKAWLHDCHVLDAAEPGNSRLWTEQANQNLMMPAIVSPQMKVTGCCRSNKYLSMVVNAVCIRQDSVPINDKSAAGGGVLPLALPGKGVVGLTVGAEHLRSVTSCRCSRSCKLDQQTLLRMMMLWFSMLLYFVDNE